MAVDAAGLEILREEQCLSLLEGTSLGRIAVTVGAVPAIFPINYRLIDGRILFRTGDGTKLHQASDHAVVAFEVDEVDPVTHAGWSVLVVGVAKEVREAHADAGLDTIPRPWAPGERDHIIAITPELVSGRRVADAG